MTSDRITKIEQISFEYEIQDMGTDYNGFNRVYKQGEVMKTRGSVLRIHSDSGLVGETTGGIQGGPIVNYLLGKNPFHREKIYSDLKRGLRHTDRTAINSLDVALWDLAGKAHEAPIYQLLGGYKEKLPAYASTYHGDENGGLDSPEAFADFAVQCRDSGYPAFKIHGWGLAAVEREVANVREVRRRVGEAMDLMLDPACEIETWAQALKVGRACDDAGFFWLEDAYKDGGVSIFGHRKLRELIKTPLLQTEHVFGLEEHVDFIVHGGTDFVRTGCYEDGGITGAMKVARAAEGFGLDVEFHGGGLAHRHCIAAIRNTNYYELGLLHPKIKLSKPPIYPLEFLDELESVDEKGRVAVPQGPGLGVEMDWDWIGAHEVGRVEYE